MPSVSSPPPPYRLIRPSGGDDYLAAQAALTACAADGKTLLIEGQLRISQGLVATDWPKGLVIRGANPASGLTPYNAAADGIKLLRCHTPSRHTGLLIRDLWFNSRSNAERMTGGCALEIEDAWAPRVQNFHCQGMYDGIILSGGDVDGTAVASLLDIGVHSFVRYGIHLKGMAENMIRNVFCDAIPYGGGGTWTPGSIGMLIESRDAIEVNHFDCVGADIGIKLKPNGTTLNINGGYWFWNCMCDTGNVGWVIDASGENLDNVEMHGCWAGYNTGIGVRIIGSQLRGVRWIGGIIQANLGVGVSIEGGDDHLFQGAIIAGNQGTGIKLAAGVDDITIQGCTIKDRIGYGGKVSVQSYGIEFNGGHSGLLITGNDITGNTVAPSTGDYSGATNRIHDNLGFNPKGSVTAPAVPSSGVATTNTFGHNCTVYVSGGTVNAIAVGGVSTGMTSGAIRVPAGQTITLTYSSAPTWTWFGE